MHAGIHLGVAWEPIFSKFAVPGFGAKAGPKMGTKTEPKMGTGIYFIKRSPFWAQFWYLFLAPGRSPKQVPANCKFLGQDRHKTEPTSCQKTPARAFHCCWQCWRLGNRKTQKAAPVQQMLSAYKLQSKSCTMTCNLPVTPRCQG